MQSVWRWLAALAYVVLGASCLQLGIFGGRKRVRALAKNRRLVWGTILGLPALLIFFGARLLGHQLPSTV